MAVVNCKTASQARFCRRLDQIKFDSGGGDMTKITPRSLQEIACSED
jgi:hypothetical protein